MEAEDSLTHLQMRVTCPILSHFNPVHVSHPTSCRSIFPSTPGFSKWSLSLRFPHQNPVCNSYPPIHVTCPLPSHYSRFYHPNNIGWGLQIIKLFVFIHSPVTSSLLGPNILLSNLFSNTLSLRSSRNVSDQFSHPYKTTGKIKVQDILIFIFLYSKL